MLAIWDYRAAALEYRGWLLDDVETLACHVHDEDLEEHLGDSDRIAHVQDALTSVQRYLSGAISDAARDAFRAQAFAEVLQALKGTISDLAEQIALNRPGWAGLVPIDHLLADARQALSWFPEQQTLTRANQLRSRAQGEQYEFLSIESLREAIERLTALRDRQQRGA